MEVSIPIKKLLYILNLHTYYVCETKVGYGTTHYANRGILDNQTNTYMVFNGNINRCFLQYPWLRLSIIRHNILENNILDSMDTRFYHPGPCSASGSETNIFGNLPFILQRPLYVLFKINFNL